MFNWMEMHEVMSIQIIKMEHKATQAREKSFFLTNLIERNGYSLEEVDTSMQISLCEAQMHSLRTL